MKIKINVLLILLLCINANAVDKYSTQKTSCIQQSNHSGKTLSELKDILLLNVKNEAIGELYGQLIFSQSNVKDGRLLSDEIKQKAIGSVRIKGNPKFYNGDDFGSICSDVTAYITKKDLEKYSPKTIKLKKFCYTNPETS